jgi:hypothetical protein
MLVAIALAAYGVYGAWQGEIILYTGGRNLEQALLHASGVTARLLGLALVFLAAAIFCFIGAAISRHPIRLERWELSAKVALALAGLGFVLAAGYFVLSAYS